MNRFASLITRNLFILRSAKSSQTRQHGQVRYTNAIQRPAGEATVTISTTSSNAIICWNTTGLPGPINGATTCPGGSTLINGSSGTVNVSASETLYAVAGGTGYADSTVGSAAYTISGSSVYYYIEDSVGSSRVITDSSGNLCYDADFYPFGGERPYTTTCSQNYKFTGKERDSESGLDDFGARFYTSSVGRFMSPDWAARPTAVPYAVLGDPQSLNLYTYVRNDPITRADADGHCAVLAADNESCASEARTESERQGAPRARPNAHQQNSADFKVSKSTYKSATGAAVAALDAVIGQSQKTGWEYGGRIVKLANGKYAYVLPTTDENSTTVNVDAGMKEGTRIPAGTTDAGIYHTHPTSCLYCAQDQFSGEDNATAVREHLPSYIESGATHSIYLLDGSTRTSIFDPTPPTVIRYGPPQ